MLTFRQKFHITNFITGLIFGIVLVLVYKNMMSIIVGFWMITLVQIIWYFAIMRPKKLVKYGKD